MRIATLHLADVHRIGVLGAGGDVDDLVFATSLTHRYRVIAISDGLITDRSAAEALLYGSLHSLNPPAQVQEALAELGIEQPWHELSDKDLRQHYRHLVSIHHPDRGGCTQRVQRINQAMDVLRKHQQRHLSRR